jgi:hypothetical protein
MVTGDVHAAWPTLAINPIIGSDEIRDAKMLRLVSYDIPRSSRSVSATPA